jgi:DNA-binding protein HU-beta
MNKANLVDAISEQTGLPKADAGKSLDAALAIVTSTLAAGNAVSLVGFGNFTVSRRNARTGRNPQTGAEIQIPARNAVKFSPGKALKDSVQ